MIHRSEFPNLSSVHIAIIVVALIFFLPHLVLNPMFVSIFPNAESYQVTLEFIFVVLIGGSISAIYKRYDKRRDRRLRTYDQLLEFYRETIESYNEVKKVRRLLEAKSRSTSNGRRAIRKDDYEILMVQLVNIQLKFKMLKRRAATTDMFADQSDVIKSSLARVEGYLNSNLVNTYQKTLGFDPTDSGDKMVSMPKEVQYFTTRKMAFFRNANRLINSLIASLKNGEEKSLHSYEYWKWCGARILNWRFFRPPTR